ncbi:flagellar biosynthetic protein FliR [Saccharibacillus kuerlensis]|uniref:Flagellar biosynthetic protein FliR n=1 Tax=Saccharibacillus kuerlensis TaxID=459527 RepID=A0ABQ2KQW6_9BACL|nr:flagellar biosynthetic protein FliR [Saccharibacillus kuerlensis]GGN90391.1 flagellar biosynthetic protein FliR [Saccharibacillus kuerlensis]
MINVMQAFPVFLLIFCRVTSFFVVAPLISSRNVPNRFKIGLGTIVAILIYLSYGTNQEAAFDEGYILLVVREILMGLLLGFVAYMFLIAIQLAGAVLDIQMGFGMASVFDPTTGAVTPLTGQFKYMIAMLIFLSMNGHHRLLDAIVYSYNWVPLDNELFVRIYDGSVSEFFLKVLGMVMVVAFQMAAPIVVALFLTDVGLGFLAKTAPQFNIFVIGIPIKILVGLTLLLLLMPSLTYIFDHLFSLMARSMEELLGTVGERPGAGDP